MKYSLTRKRLVKKNFRILMKNEGVEVLLLAWLDQPTWACLSYSFLMSFFKTLPKKLRPKKKLLLLISHFLFKIFKTNVLYCWPILLKIKNV